MGDVSKINQKELKYSCSAGEASVNLYTGRLLFEHPDMVIGAGSFQIGISHIYNSHFEGHISHDTHMGKNWKLNVQQYLARSSDTKYYYYDSMGYKHTFERYKYEYTQIEVPSGWNYPTYDGQYYTSKSCYYDTTGLGLTLTVINQVMWSVNKPTTGNESIRAYISDEFDNEMEFREDGKIDYTTSSFNANIIKKYTYNSSGQITSIYDARKPLRTIVFSYKNNLLYEIKCEASKEALYYTYDIFGNIITMTKKTNNITSKTVATFTYNGSNMRYAYGSDLSALQFIYTADNKINQVKNCTVSISQNYIKGQANYVGDDIYLGEDIYVGEEEKILTNCDVGVPNAYVKSTSIFTYSNNSTSIINEKGIRFAYFFNEEGFTTGIFEDTGTSGYRTLTKTSGWELCDDGESPVKVNGKKANIINGNAPCYSIPVDKIDELKYFFFKNDNGSERKLTYTDRFVVSFWACFNATQSNVIAKFCNYSFTVANNQREYVQEDFTSNLGNVLASSWQYITIPIRFDNHNLSFIPKIKENLYNMSLYFEGYNGQVLLSDLRIAVGNDNYIMIDDKEFNKADKIVYKDNAGAIHNATINSSFFMTEGDLFKTYKNMYRQQGTDSNKPYDLVACSGTKVISVLDAYADYTSPSSNKPFKLIYLDTGGAKPNYYAESRNRSANLKWCLTESQVRFRDDYYEQKTSIDFVDLYTEKVRENQSSKIYTWTYNNGNPRASKDAYDVETFNKYDDYGNITSIETYYEKNQAGERLITSYDYGSVTEELREQPVSSTSNGITKYYTYEDPWILPSKSTIGNQTSETSYDVYHDRIKMIQNKDTETGIIEAKTNFMFDDAGRLKKVWDQNNRNYSFEYNVFGEATKYFEGNNLLLEKDIQRNKNYTVAGKTLYNADKITEKRYRTSSTTPDITEVTLDKYGKVQTQANNGKTTTYSYQDSSSSFKESSTLAKIESIYDPYEDQTFYYEYDEENRPFGWWTNDIWVRQLNQTDTEYKFYSDNITRTSSIVMEDSEVDSGKNIYINPRIHRTNDKTDDFADDEKEFEVTYKYDKFGRLEQAQSKRITYNISNGVTPSITIEYKPNTAFIKKQKHNITHYNNSFGHSDIYFDTTITHEYEYDNKGNIILFTEEGKGFKEVPVRKDRDDLTTLSKTISYEYDSQNRLKRENNSVLGNMEYTYESVSNKIKNIKIGTSIIKSFSYSNNKKISYVNNGTTYPITYDNYRNVTKHMNNTITYNTRNLISNIGGNIYEYNHQGVRFKKVLSDGITKVYFLDGSRILGEDWSNSSGSNTHKIRYFYNAQGIAGLRYEGYNFNFVRDAMGNVSKVMHRGKLIAEYNYDAWGNCTTNYLGTRTIRDDFVVDNNPFRWKGHYFDTETELYYINSRYYSPEIMMYLDAENPENLIENAYILNALDRNAITLDNSVGFKVNNDNIFTSMELFPDPNYDPNKEKSWWQLNWKKAIQWIICATVFLISVVLMCNPVTIEFGAGMFMAGIKAAISGFVIGGIIGGIISAIHGNSFLEGATEGAIYGAINGFSTGAIMYCVSQGISAVANAANKAKAPLNNCFIAGTLVLTIEGYKAIEDIKVGDEVLSYDEETGASEYKKVVDLFRNGRPMNHTQDNDIGEGVKDWINVRVSKESTKEELDLITCTFEHPFYVLNASSERTKVLFEGSNEQAKESTGTWIAAKDLKAGDKLLLSSGENAIITSLEVEHYEEAQTTYNFEVEISLSLLRCGERDNITAKEGTTYNVESKGLISAKDIIVGDKIILESGEVATVLSAETKTVGGPMTTYNLEVEDFHTYYVGTSGILVHNMCGDDAFDVMQFDDAAIAEAKTPIIDKFGNSRNPSFQTFKNRLFAAQERLHPGTFDELITGINPSIQGQQIILHHPLGRAGANLYNVVGVTQKQHLAIHAIIGYRNANWAGVMYNLGSGVF